MNNLNRPSISVCVPYYNDSAFLRECIDSILNQTFTDFELILLNHASTDGSNEIARSYQDARIKHIDLEKNNGAGGGLILMEFLKIAQGKYFKPFCADDVMRTDCLMMLRLCLESNPDIDLVFGNMRIFDHRPHKNFPTWWDLEKAKRVFNGDEVEILRQFFIGNSALPFPSSMCKLEVLNKIEVDRVLHTQFDMTMWVQILAKGYKVKCIYDIVCDYRIHADQASSSSKKEAIYRSSSFENLVYCNYFAKITSIELVKKLLPSSLYASLLAEGDLEYIPFVMFHHYSNATYPFYAIAGLKGLYQILSDDQMRVKVEQKFGYSIKSLREKYANVSLYNNLDYIDTKRMTSCLFKRFKVWLKCNLRLRKRKEGLGFL